MLKDNLDVTLLYYLHECYHLTLRQITLTVTALERDFEFFVSHRNIVAEGGYNLSPTRPSVHTP